MSIPPRFLTVSSVLLLLIVAAGFFLINRPGEKSGQAPAGSAASSPPQGERAGGGGDSHGRREQPEGEPVSDAEAQETTRLFLVKLDADSLHHWETEIRPVEEAIRRLSPDQLEQLIRTLAGSGRKIGNDEMSWEDFPLTVLAGREPLRAVNLYSELWPEGGAPGPKTWLMLPAAAEKDPQGVAAWLQGQAGRRDEQTLAKMRTQVLSGAMSKGAALAFRLMPQTGVTDYRQAARDLTEGLGNWGKEVGTGPYLVEMRRFAAKLSPEEGAALQQGAMEGVAKQILLNGDSGIEQELDRWPLQGEEMTTVLEAVVRGTTGSYLAPWLTGPSRSPATQMARRLFLEQPHGETPEQREKIRAALE